MNYMKEEEDGRLRNLNLIIETYSDDDDDDDDNNNLSKRMKIILTGISASSILLVSFYLTKYLYI